MKKSFISLFLPFLFMGTSMNCVFGNENAQPAETPTVEKTISDTTVQPKNQQAAAPQSAIEKSMNGFSMDWYRNMAAEYPQENVLISPMGMYRVLGMLNVGSKNQTKAQLQKTMHWDGNPSEFLLSLRELATQYESANEVLTADSLWLQKDFPVNSRFIDAMDVCKTDVRQADFGSDSVCEVLNNWVKEKTNGKIGNIFSNIPGTTQLLLTNTILFQGEWKDAFNKEKTVDRPFTTLNKEVVQFPMMYRKGTYRLFENEKYQWLELPYQNDRFFMGIFLPRPEEDFLAMEKMLTPELLTKCSSEAAEKTVHVRIPKFTCQNSLSPMAVLEKMGLKNLFNPTADLSLICRLNTLYASELLQGTYLKVDEAGTEAAAVTTVVMVPKMLPRDNDPLFFADRPFFYVIGDRQTNMFLFTGRFVDPTKMAKETVHAETKNTAN